MNILFHQVLELLFHQAEGDCIVDCPLEFENLFEQSELVAISYLCLLEKIVFVADYIEPRRNKASNLSKLRQMAFIDIDRTVYEIMDQTLRYLKSKKVPIDSLTKKSCDYYRALCGEKDVENETERN